MIYITSDLHVSHQNIIKYTSRYINDALEYSKEVHKYFKSVLKDSDILMFLGDLDCGPNKNIEFLRRFISSLPGKKIFVRGNHDKWLDTESILYIGFSAVSDIIRYKDTLFCHYPLDSRSVIPKEAPEFLKSYDLTGIKKIYHGHTHNNWIVDSKDGIERINCCIDRNPEVIGALIPFEI